MSTLRTHMRWIMIVIIAAFLLSTFFMYGSGSRSGGGASTEGVDYAVADVNGSRLMRSELDRIVLNYVESMGNREIASDDWPGIYQTALQQYAVERQMAQEVESSGITVSDAEAEQAMKDYADQAFPTREAFYQYLERSGQRPADYKKLISQQMATQRLLIESIGTIEVSEDEATQFYDNMKELFFRQPAGFNVNLIRLRSDSDAEKIRTSLLASADWSAATSGDAVASMDVLYVTSEPIFASTSAFSGGYLDGMKSSDIGAVSPVFEINSDDFGVGIKTEALEERITPYDDVSADIRMMLQSQQERQAFDQFSQEMLNKAEIVIHDETLFPPVTSEPLPVTAPQVSSNVPASADLPASGDTPAPSAAPASGDVPASADAAASGDAAQ